jgi:hypothetical protein
LQHRGVDLAIDGVGRWVRVDRVVLGCHEERMMSGGVRPKDARVRGTGYQHRVGVDDPGPEVVDRAPRRWRWEPLSGRGRIGGGTVALSTVAATPAAMLTTAVAASGWRRLVAGGGAGARGGGTDAGGVGAPWFMPAKKEVCAMLEFWPFGPA